MAQERQEHSQSSRNEQDSMLGSRDGRAKSEDREKSTMESAGRSGARRKKASSPSQFDEMVADVTDYAKEHPMLLLAVAGATAGLALSIGRSFKGPSEPQKTAAQLQATAQQFQASAQQLFDSVRKQASDSHIPDDLRRYAEAGYEMGTRKLQESVSSNPLTASGLLLGLGYLVGSACAGMRSKSDQ